MADKPTEKTEKTSDAPDTRKAKTPKRGVDKSGHFFHDAPNDELIQPTEKD